MKLVVINTITNDYLDFYWNAFQQPSKVEMYLLKTP